MLPSPNGAHKYKKINITWSPRPDKLKNLSNGKNVDDNTA